MPTASGIRNKSIYRQNRHLLDKYHRYRFNSEFRLSTGMLLQLGQAVFNLHEIPVPESLRGHFSYGLESFEDVIDAALDHPFRQWLTEKKAYLSYHIIERLPRGLVHGDIFCDNMLYVGDRLEAIIDFEEACHYYKVFDLGMCALGCCVENGHVSPDKVGALVKGYERGRKLETEEREQLRLFIEYAAAATAFWRFRQYNILFPRKEMANHYLEIKRIADHIHAVPEDEFKTTVFGTPRRFYRSQKNRICRNGAPEGYHPTINIRPPTP